MRFVSRALSAWIAILAGCEVVAGQVPEPAATGAIEPAAGANPPAETVAVPLPAGCDNRPDAIGLSRIVEIDTTGGPRLGHSQYKDVDFLQDGEIVLTFDDGPIRRYTKPILDTLDAHCTRATFFSVGRMAVSDPETLKETASRGHTIASHTWSHAKLTTLTPAKAKYEIELGNSAVTLALGKPVVPFFRFPYLRDNKATLDYLKTRNMSAISIEVDSQDFRTHNPGQVLRTVMTQLKSVKKGIILFHDIQPSTAGALSSLLDSLKKGGFTVVHLVSKYPNTTLPEFDAMAAREFERKRLALAGQPLANRAVTWPNSPGAAIDEPAAKPQLGAPKSSTAPANDQKLPWAGTAPAQNPVADAARSAPPETSAPEPPLPPAPKPVRKPIWYGLDDDPWRIKTMGD
ncbi:MAG: polysaccharide deacetylase family protein [Hyphomicrobium sp.]